VFGEFSDTVNFAENKIKVLKERLILMEKILSNDRIEKRVAEVEADT